MNELSPLKQAFLAIEKLQKKLAEMENAQHEPIAVVGMGCRLPGGANSPQAFWKLLRDGRDGITKVPASRWNAGRYYDPDPQKPDKIATDSGGFVDNVTDFDARFFNIAPREAEKTDPQQRLLLEVAWEALESAGQPPDQLAGTKTGVYVGMINSEYGWLQLRDIPSLDVYSGTGISQSVASGRLSYLLGLQGPSMTIDTACSSSLVTIHLACQALRAGECDLALAGGVSLMLSPLSLISVTRMGLIAKDGRCKTLDSRADGFGAGEGCALLVLKRLSDALANDDPILALIRGSAVNQDGRTNVLSAPNGLAQQAVIQQAMSVAKVSPEDISFVELHGTGTELGDPIEVDALRRLFRGQRTEKVWLGAVKSSIGHTGAVAGIAGVIKTILAMQHDTIPPNLHFQSLNPHITLDDTPFAIPTDAKAWQKGGDGRKAGVSSFGWSGTNAHLILSDPPMQELERAKRMPAFTLPISARDSAALQALATHYQKRLASATDLPDLVYSSAVGRAHHPHRLTVTGKTAGEMGERLGRWLVGDEDAGIDAGHYPSPQRRKLVWVFSPHGGQWAGMGRDLLAKNSVFRESLLACERAISPYVDWSLMELLGGDDDAWMDEIDQLQPILFALQVGMARQWMAWGVKPDLIVGHSMGEVAAGHLAGILSLDDSARIICRRTQLLAQLQGEGTMGMVELGVADARKVIAPYGDKLHIAVSNSPRSTIIAGDTPTLEALFAQLSEQEIFCGWGVADVASHSPSMAGLEGALREGIGDIERQPAKIPIYSTVTGKLDDGTGFDTDYWVRHLNQTTLFADAVAGLLGSGHTLFLEMSPAPTLAPAIEEGGVALGVDGVVVVSTWQRSLPAFEGRLRALGQLYVAGYEVAWKRVYERGVVVAMPAYPWQRQRFWLDKDVDSLLAERSGGGVFTPMLGEEIVVADAPSRQLWQMDWDKRRYPILFEHRLFGNGVMPASAFLQMSLLSGVSRLAGIQFHQMLHLPEQAVWQQTQLIRDEERLQLWGLVNGEWGLIAAGECGDVDEGQISVTKAEIPNPKSVGEGFYAELAERGVLYGDGLRVFDEVVMGDTVVQGELSLPASIGYEAADGVHLTWLDGMLQLAGWLVVQEAGVWQIAGIGEMVHHLAGEMPATVQAKLVDQTAHQLLGEVAAFDSAGKLILSLRQVEFRQITSTKPESPADWLYEISWQSVPMPSSPSEKRTGRWLIVEDKAGVGKALAEKLEQVTLLGNSLQVAEGLGEDVCGLVYLPSADRVALTDEGGAWSAGNFLSMLRAIENAQADHPLPIWIGTNGAHPPYQSKDGLMGRFWWGLGLTLAEERHEWWGGLVELDPMADAERNAQFLANHLQADDGEDRVIWRNGERLAGRLMAMQKGEESKSVVPALNVSSAYLVTGAFGDIGMATAQWLAKQGARRLILLGRTPLPARRDWGALKSDSVMGKRVADLLALEQMGVSVHLAAVDVGDEQMLTGWLRNYEAEGYPPIRGVVHSAAVIEDKLLLDLDAGSLQQVALPKAWGAWYLHDYFGENALDFFWLYSSAGSVLGAVGQGNYAAANAFVDGLAHYRRGLGLPAVAINWGFWQDMGFANTPGGERVVAYMSAMGMHSFSRQQALAVLAHGWRVAESAQLVALRVDWDRWRQRAREVGVPALLRDFALESEGVGDAGVVSFREELAKMPAVDHPKQLGKWLRQQLAGVLAIEPTHIALETPIGTLGLDSFTAIELRNRLEQALGLSLSATLAWNYPTISAMVPFLLGRMDLVEREEEESGSPTFGDDFTQLLSEAEALTDDELMRLLQDGLD